MRTVWKIALFCTCNLALAAPPDRITRPIDTRRTRAISGNTRRAAQPQFDLGGVDPATPMDYMMLMIKPSAAQQEELDRLLVDQQNPASPLFHQWLTPEQFADRFGLSTGDQSRIASWLASEGFAVKQTARSRNWIAFSGSAGQVSRALHTGIHRFQVDGPLHFANTGDPAVPEALADVVSGFLGLDDFHLKSLAIPVPPGPDLNSGVSHFLAPADFATIYNVSPLYSAGVDGTGQGIAIVGESEVLLSDLRAFRTRYGLPANDPKFILYAGTSPGFNGAQLEGNLDLEWAGAIAPNATIYYVYGPDALAAMVAAVNLNVAPVISVSYGICEVDGPAFAFNRSIGQQANAQGITILVASGDSGAAGCDAQGVAPFAAKGEMIDFPAVLPEVTAVGGTQFVEGNGAYWAPTNSPTFGSALRYIPEAAWNESDARGLLSGGGGASLFYARPAWQTGPGVPNDNTRHVPDLSLSAALHDAYAITYQGGNVAVGGTSASAPSLAGVIALLNHYHVTQGFQAKPGLGNINPQLYRLAQSVPAAFHDTTAGDNIVPCAQGTEDCLTGSFGYPTGPAYDMATGLGSIDANVLVTQWHTQTAGVGLVLAAPAQATLNDTVTATASVFGKFGGPSATPTGTVDFSIGALALGSGRLTSDATSSVTFPLYRLGPGTYTLNAVYSGDGVFTGGGATARLQVTTPARVSAIVLSGPNTVFALPADAKGESWQTTVSLREAAGVPSRITGFSVDGLAQPLEDYFPSPEIPASSTVRATILFRDLAAPVTRTLAFTGIDSAGQTWTRQLSVNYYPLPTYFNFMVTATPLRVNQSPSASTACQWPVHLRIDELGGNQTTIAGLFTDNINITSQAASIFGTTRLEAWGSLAGTICYGGLTPPASSVIEVDLSDGLIQTIVVDFGTAPAAPVTLSATPGRINLMVAAAGLPAQASLAIGISDKTQPWTAAIYPANRTTEWLSVSQLSGTGPSTMALTASGTGFEPGVYRASIVIQSANAAPQHIEVPVMFVWGAGSGTFITGVANPASSQTTASPGMILSIFGSNLANDTQMLLGSPLPYSNDGVSATVNGDAAPLLYISSNQLNIQVPYTVGAGPGVVGVNNNGQIAGFPVQIAPASPGVFADSDGNLTSVQQGSLATIMVTGIGDVPALRTAFAPAATTPLAGLPKPALPFSVAVGGMPAFLQVLGIAPGSVGVARVDFIVPSTVPPGPQPVVVTVGNISSSPVNLTVTPAASATNLPTP